VSRSLRVRVIGAAGFVGRHLEPALEGAAADIMARASAALVTKAADAPSAAPMIGDRAQEIAVTRFSRTAVASQFHVLLSEVADR